MLVFNSLLKSRTEMNNYFVLALLYIRRPKLQGDSNIRCLLNVTIKNGMEATISKKRFWHKLPVTAAPDTEHISVRGCSLLLA